MNNQNSFYVIATLGFLALMIFSFPLQADNNVAKAKYQICSACHGAKGEGGIGPALAGKSSEYITNRLRSYKLGETIGDQSALMWGQSATLTENDIDILANYLESLSQ